MKSKADEVLEAHGGIEHWNRFSQVTATIVTGGELWAMKGLIQDPAPRTMTVSLHEERASVTPFGEPKWGLHPSSATPRRKAGSTEACL